MRVSMIRVGGAPLRMAGRVAGRGQVGGQSTAVNLTAYCTVAEACAIAGVSDGYMRRLLRDGKVEGHKVGTTYLVVRSSVAAFHRQPGMGRPVKSAGTAGRARRGGQRRRTPRK